MHVGELRAQRTREAQVEEAVLAHRPADVEQQHEARAHAAAVLPGQPERRAAAADAAADRALQVEAAAVRRKRASRRSCRCFRRRAKRRISASMSRTWSARSRSRKSVGRERLLAARAMPCGTAVVVAACARAGGGDAAARDSSLRRRRQCSGGPVAGGVALGKGPPVRRQEVGVEQRVEAPPLVAAAAQQRLQAPAQDLAVESADVRRRFEHARRIAAADAIAVGAQEAGKSRQARPQRDARIGRRRSGATISMRPRSGRRPRG